MRTEAVSESGTSNNNIVKKIKTQINGSWVEVMVYINSLREALGIPLHDILNAGMHHGCVHNETVGPDVEDTDNRALLPVQLQHLPLPQSPQPSLALTRTTLPSPTCDFEVNEDLKSA